MRCSTAKQLLRTGPQLLSRTRAESLDEHLRTCETCTAFAARCRELEAALVADVEATVQSGVSPDFDHRLHAALVVEQNARHEVSARRSVLTALRPAAAVATAALGIFLLLCGAFQSPPPAPVDCRFTRIVSFTTYRSATDGRVYASLSGITTPGRTTSSEVYLQ